MESGLLTRWKDLTTFLPDAARDVWWTRILEAYSQRPFRGLRHLSEMFLLFDSNKDSLNDRYATAFAIFFKNIVYDPLSDDNAEKSAQVLREFAQATTFDAENYVADMILSSASSSTEANMVEGVFGSDDIHFLIDFDLAFLGDSPDRFEEQEKAQRKEYAHLSDDEYRKQRLKLLQLFLQVPNIYGTKEMRTLLEKRARENIQKEIELLQNGERKY